jgi:four helix bundle protein
MRKELESRLIALSVSVNKLVSRLGRNPLTNNLSDQMIRSSTSAALNYGEVQSAESRKDFIHKNSVVLKELRETSIGLKILLDSESVEDEKEITIIIQECNHLTAIFQKTVTTSKSKIH